MVCEECKQRPATFHVTKIVNGQKSEQHLCEQCAAAVQQQSGLLGSHPFTVQDLLAGMLNFGMHNDPHTQQNEPRCPRCGMSFAEISRHGRMGCSECYNCFADLMKPLIRRVQGSITHHGKIPARAGAALKQRHQLRDLRDDLQRCVAREEYERAAVIRDQIKQLEQSQRQNQGGEGDRHDDTSNLDAATE